MWHALPTQHGAGPAEREEPRAERITIGAPPHPSTDQPEWQVVRTASEGQGQSRRDAIYQRKDTGTWCAAITLDNGRRKYLYGATREEVGQKLTRALVDRQNGMAPANQRETVASWLSQYLDDLEARGAPHSTISRYRGIFVNYVSPLLGKHKLAQLQPQHVQAYQTTLLKRGFSASSITVHRAVLSGALKQAVSFGLLPRNVVPLVKRPAKTETRKAPPLRQRRDGPFWMRYEAIATRLSIWFC